MWSEDLNLHSRSIYYDLVFTRVYCDYLSPPRCWPLDSQPQNKGTCSCVWRVRAARLAWRDSRESGMRRVYGAAGGSGQDPWTVSRSPGSLNSQGTDLTTLPTKGFLGEHRRRICQNFKKISKGQQLGRVRTLGQSTVVLADWNISVETYNFTLINFKI